MNKVDVSYVTTLPLKGNSPRVRVNDSSEEEFKVKFYNHNEFIKEVKCKGGEEVYGGRQWFHNWRIDVYDSNGQLYYNEVFEPKGKVIFIKIDAYALGDNIAWIPIINHFRRKHKCKIICSTFWNNLFIDSYSDIMFVEPNTTIHNVYAQYYIGAHKSDGIYSPSDVSEIPLQKVASDILGMKHFESVPYIGKKYFHMKPKIEGRYVCLSEHASGVEKQWRETNGWQKVVDYLNSQDIKVVVISKEPTELKNVIDLTGNIPIEERMLDIMHAECYLGVSSGLAWLAWALNTKVIMVSDCTPKWHEFEQNCKRLCENDLNKVNYNYEKITPWKKVVESLIEFNVY